MSELEGGFVSAWRKMHEWEWYDDDAIFKIFIGFLWLANYRDQQWKGITIKRGSFVTSVANLCTYFRKSKNTILRCLDCLKSTGEILDEVVPNKYRIITVVNYDKYQSVVQNLNNKRDNKKYNKRDNNLNNHKNNCKDNERDTTNKYNKENKETSGGVCPTGTHTPPQKKNKAAQTSVTPLGGEPSEPLSRREWRTYCESKGYDEYRAGEEWIKARGVFTEEQKKKVREWLKEHGSEQTD